MSSSIDCANLISRLRGAADANDDECRNITADLMREAAAALEHYYYADIEHEHLGCHVAKTGIYAKDKG